MTSRRESRFPNNGNKNRMKTIEDDTSSFLMNKAFDILKIVTKLDKEPSGFLEIDSFFRTSLRNILFWGGWKGYTAGESYGNICQRQLWHISGKVYGSMAFVRRRQHVERDTDNRSCMNLRRQGSKITCVVA
ncbi:hypothetical protein TNCT_379331 [Trichonephila clavata]|uniref:Uncharacterized protein n=1 Tax=Trichonephila clavata TaxID=2740835 RepID=A0A8X6M3B2_TRICU|nr:hypothetical protein TNCT_379331 [Trichonephila clavata]